MARMRPVELVEDDKPVAEDQTPNDLDDADMHVKQVADLWKVSSRTITDLIVRVQNKCYGALQPDSSYRLGRAGERNRTYLSKEERFLLQKERFGTLEINTKAQRKSVEQIEEDLRKATQQQSTEDTQAQNKNLQSYRQAKEGSGDLIQHQRSVGRVEGRQLARARHDGRVRGYLEGVEASNVAMAELAKDLTTGTMLDPVVIEADLYDIGYDLLEGAM